MDIQTEKLRLIEQLLQVSDANVIAKIKEVLKNTQDPVVGYDVNGSAIAQTDFIKMIEEAEVEYNAGKYQTLDELDKESEKW